MQQLSARTIETRFNAALQLANEAPYTFSKEAFWDASIKLKRDDVLYSSMKIGWKGVYITTYFNGAENTYILKNKGLAQRKYVLCNEQGIVLATFIAKFSWKQFKYHYDIEPSFEYDQIPERDLLCLITLHGINYCMRLMVGR
jgi:maltose-binding protein MalE